jgi:hypothetical protein
VLLKQVDPSHVDYARIEANAVTLAGLTNRYGRPFNLVRVYCPEIPSGDVAAYTNALVLNTKVLVPLFNVPEDEAALQVYRDHMPGYEVIGFTHPGWISDDALHCRVLQVHDRYMLRMDHNPIQQAVAGQPASAIVYADDRSESVMDLATSGLYWRVAGNSAFQLVPLVYAPGEDFYAAEIPAQSAGSAVEYYVEVADWSGRTAERPRGAPAATFSYV